MNSCEFTSHERILGIALRNQVIEDVRKNLIAYPDKARIDGVRIVMNFVLGSESNHDNLELSVGFANDLVQMMLSFVQELILERIAEAESYEDKFLQSLSERGDGVSVRSVGVYKDTELEECDSYLRSLRSLQSDMSRLEEINLGAIASDLVISRPTSVVGAMYPEGTSVDQVVERSLLTGNSCAGVHWLSVRFGESISVGETVRSVSRLISYLYFNSASIDSFFVGIHILRQSGQHVEKVLSAIYENSSLKAVRDRIARHLSHRGSPVSSEKLRQLEIIYPNNCYWTELNRGWTCRALKAETSHSNYFYSASSPKTQPAQIHVECGNIPDIPMQLEGHGAGQIGSVGTEESQSVVKCVHCLEDRKDLGAQFFCPGDGSEKWGYLHITEAWIGKMTQQEFDLIIAEGRSASSQELAILHKDWSRIIQETELAAPFVNGGGNNVKRGKFLDRVISDVCMRQKLRENGVNGMTRTDLARISSLFLQPQLATSATFHSHMLTWIMAEKSLPQLALLYLRHYRLGQSESAVHELLQGIADSSALRFLTVLRLGNAFLPLIAADNFDPLTAVALWMMSGNKPISSVIFCIKQEFPIFDQFLKFDESVRDDENQDPQHDEAPSDIFQVLTYKGDVSILQLLQDVFPELDFGTIAPPPVTPVVRGATRVEYLLSQGRPALAFQECTGSEDPIILSAAELHKAARRVAFYNLFDDGIVAAAVSFLDLFGESTETLRVDVQSARTILSSTIEGTSSETIRNLFLDFQSSSNNAQLLSGLKLLEESAWAKEPPITDQAGTAQAASSNCPASSPTSAGGGFESPWHLVALFCRVHNLPRSLTLLHELARNGDWVMFLHESDLQQCPLETVRDVINSYFHETPLRSHLNILLDTSPPKRQNAQVASACVQELMVLPEELLLDVVLRERRNLIFENRSDPALLFVKFFHLCRFGHARECFAQIESPENINSAISAILATNPGSLQRKELESIIISAGQEQNNQLILTPVSHDDPSTELPPVDVNNEPLPQPLVVKSVNIEEIRDAVNKKKWPSYRNLVSSQDDLSALVHVLVDEFEEGDPWNEDDYDGLISIVAFTQLEALGDLVLQRSIETACCRSQKYHLNLVVYSAYAAGFVDHDKFQRYTNSIGNEQAGTFFHLAESGSDQKSQIALADTLMNRTVPGSSPNCSLLALAAAIKLSRVYLSLDLIGKHLKANQIAESLARSIRIS